MTKEEKEFFAFIDTATPEQIFALLALYKSLEKMAENTCEEADASC